MKNRLLIIPDGYASPVQGVTVPPFGHPDLTPLIVSRVQKDYANWDLEVTAVNDPNDTRPTAIVALGGTSTTGGGTAFVGGFYNVLPNDAFVFADDSRFQYNWEWLADATSHEAGHLFGLNHSTQVGAIMNPNPYGYPEPFWTPSDVAKLTEVLGLATTPTPIPLPIMLPNDCQITITAPLTAQAGSTFQATFTIKNVGSNTWQPKTNPASLGYALGSYKDSPLWGVGRLDLPAIVASGGSVTLTGSFKAPTAPGDYPFAWDMVQELVAWFGKTASQTIRVTSQGAIPVSINNVPGIWTPT